MTSTKPGELAARKNQQYSNHYFNENVKGTDQFICMGILGHVLPADECWIAPNPAGLEKVEDVKEMEDIEVVEEVEVEVE